LKPSTQLVQVLVDPEHVAQLSMQATQDVPLARVPLGQTATQDEPERYVPVTQVRHVDVVDVQVAQLAVQLAHVRTPLTVVAIV